MGDSRSRAASRSRSRGARAGLPADRLGRNRRGAGGRRRGDPRAASTRRRACSARSASSPTSRCGPPPPSRRRPSWPATVSRRSALPPTSPPPSSPTPPPTCAARSRRGGAGRRHDLPHRPARRLRRPSGALQGGPRAGREDRLPDRRADPARRLRLARGGLAAAGARLRLGAVTGALIYLLSQQMEMSIFVTNMASMIGIGVAVDYSLFILARFREEVRSGDGARGARDGARDLGPRGGLLGHGGDHLARRPLDGPQPGSALDGARGDDRRRGRRARRGHPAAGADPAARQPVEAGGVIWGIIVRSCATRSAAAAAAARPTPSGSASGRRWTARVMKRPVLSVAARRRLPAHARDPGALDGDRQQRDRAVPGGPRRPRRHRSSPSRRRRRAEPGPDRRQLRQGRPRRARPTPRRSTASRTRSRATPRSPRVDPRRRPRRTAPR